MSEDYSFLRSGLLTALNSTNSVDEEHHARVLSILLMFVQDSVETAAMYAIGQGRTKITGADQLKALQYQARMFFQQGDLETRSVEALQTARSLLRSDEGDEDDEYNDDENEDDDGSEEDDEQDNENEDDDDDDDDSEDDDDTDDDDDHAAMLQRIDGPEMEAAQRMVTRVDAICKSWANYEPDDPVMAHIKAIVDRTIANFPQSNEYTASNPT
jgi:hypothetical protein